MTSEILHLTIMSASILSIKTGMIKCSNKVLTFISKDHKNMQKIKSKSFYTDNLPLIVSIGMTQSESIHVQSQCNMPFSSFSNYKHKDIYTLNHVNIYINITPSS